MTLLTDRRRFLAACSSLGLTSTLLPGVLRAMGAVDYINANRARLLAMEGMAKTFADVDVIVAPTDDPQVLLTNLTGHPVVIVPNGFWEDGTSVSLSFLGRLYGEAKMLAVARAYQEATGFHLRQPKL